MLVDVDYFKQFNDHYGHQVGDQCLQQVASLLATVLRREDDPLPVTAERSSPCCCPAPPAGGHADRRAGAYLVASPSAFPTTNPGSRGRVSCSFGVATLVPDQHHSIAELIQKADGPSIRPSIMAGIVSK